jgi:exonuclease SbcC
MPQQPSSLNPVPMAAVATYLRRVLPSSTIEDIGVDGIELLLLRTGYQAIGIGASQEASDEVYKKSYAQYKSHFLRTEKSQLVDPAFALLLPSDLSGDIERFSSVIETDVYFCRKFVVPLQGTLEKSLARLPFLPLAPIGAASLRPASAQTFLQRHGVVAALAKSLVTPHKSGPEKTVNDAVRGLFGKLALDSSQITAELGAADRSVEEVVIDAITIEGIRAYKRPQTFSLGAAVTVLYGPNGFGKTSFFDAIDFAITGGLGRLSSLNDSQLEKVLPHLDTKPRDGSVNLSFRRNGKVGSLTRTVRDRKWAMLDGQRADRKMVLSSLTKGANLSADRIENFISLFRATHLFNQEQQEIAKDFKNDCQLNEAVVSRLLAFEDYNNAVTKLERINKDVEERLEVLDFDIGARNADISKARAEIERTEKSLRAVASPVALDKEFDALRALLGASQTELELSTADIAGLKELRGAIEAKIAQAVARIQRLNGLVGDISARPKVAQEFAGISTQLTDLQGASTAAVAERTQAEKAFAQMDLDVAALRAEVAVLIAQLNQLSWISEIVPRRAHVIAEMTRLQALRTALSNEVAGMQERDTSLSETIAKAEDALGAAHEQVEELTERERALRTFAEMAAEWPVVQERISNSVTQLAELRAARDKAAASVKVDRDELQGLETEIGEISETIRRADEHSAELRQLLALLEGHAAGEDCPLCGQEYRSHDELIARIQAKSAQDPLHEIKASLAAKRARQLEVQSHYDGARRILRTTETQLAESERANATIRQRMQEIIESGSENGFSLDAPDFVANTVTDAVDQTRKSLAASSERARSQRQVVDQAKATLASAASALKRRQDEIARTDALVERQRAEAGRLQSDNRYSETLVTLPTGAREERKAALDQALTEKGVRLATMEAEHARLKRTIADLTRRHSGIGAQIQQTARRDAELRSLQSAADQRIVSAGLPADTSNEELLIAVSGAAKAQSDMEILKEKAVSLEVGLDAAASAAILEQHRATISTNDVQVKTLRQRQRRLREAERYFGEIHRLVSAQQNEAISNFTLEYGPRTSVIQRRLRSVYSFDDVEIHAEAAKITVSVKRNGEELRPIDFFSQSQQQTLMLGLFLTACSAQTWSSFSTVFLDDPVTHFDDLNTYALLDLIAGLLENADGGKQFIISTCDDRFLELARQKFRAVGDRARFYQFTAIGSDGPVVSELN